jgi:hypothetical protein
MMMLVSRDAAATKQLIRFSLAREWETEGQRRKMIGGFGRR